MPAELGRRPLLLAAAGLATLWTGSGTASAAPAAEHDRAPRLTPTLTEEGQKVVYDRYTWQRRELCKRLPLNEPWPGEDRIAAAFQRFGLANPPAPDSIPVPSQILTDVYLVNSQPNHTYLIDCGAAGLAMIDPGLASNVEAITHAIAKLGFDPKMVRWVINTHAHFDHSMADSAFEDRGAKILIGRPDAPAVEKGTDVTARFIFPPAIRDHYPMVKHAEPLDDGEVLTLGNKTFHVIATPGHTPGSACYLLTIEGKNILFGGDTILFDYRLGDQRTAFTDDAAYLASFRKVQRFPVTLAPTRWDVLLPGHGTLVLDRANMDIAKGLRQVQWCVSMSEPIKALPFSDDFYRTLMFGRP